MAENKKGFKAGVYAVIVTIILAVVLTAMTIFAFTTRYTGFKADKVAQQYVDTIVQTGDGYNAYKNTLVSEKQKYGNFVINAYMAPYVNDGDDVKQADFVGKGDDKEQKAIDEVYNTMYDYYVELINQYGWDNYDAVFSNYFAKLKEVRHAVYGDDFMDTEYMFGALESNVTTYGENLTGADEVLADDGKTVLKEAFDGKYTEVFGKDYKLTSVVKSCDELSGSDKDAYVNEFKTRIKPVAESGTAKAESFKLQDTDDSTPKSDMVDAFANLDCSDSIESVAKAEVEVQDQNEKVVAAQEVYVVKIGNCWYVDNTNIDTKGLYFAK